jgi:hypothetical protein
MVSSEDFKGTSTKTSTRVQYLGTQPLMKVEWTINGTTWGSVDVLKKGQLLELNDELTFGELGDLKDSDYTSVITFLTQSGDTESVTVPLRKTRF